MIFLNVAQVLDGHWFCLLYRSPYTTMLLWPGRFITSGFPLKAFSPAVYHGVNAVQVILFPLQGGKVVNVIIIIFIITAFVSIKVHNYFRHSEDTVFQDSEVFGPY